MIEGKRIRRAVSGLLFAATVGLAGPAAATCGLAASVAAVDQAARALALGGSDGDARFRGALRALTDAIGQTGSDRATLDMARAYASSMERILTGAASPSSALSARQAGMARAVAAAGAAAGCETGEPTGDERSAATGEAIERPFDAPLLSDRDIRAENSGGAGERSTAAAPPQRIGDGIGTLSAISLSLPSSDSSAVLRYLPFIALAFCLFLAFRIEDRRGHRRYRCSIPLKLPDMGDARLVDVSRAGAKIAAETPPNRGERVALIVKGEHMGGAVLWSNRSYFGLRFDRLLSEDAVSRLRVAEKSQPAAEAPAPAAGVATARAETQPADAARWYKT